LALTEELGKIAASDNDPFAHRETCQLSTFQQSVEAGLGNAQNLRRLQTRIRALLQLEALNERLKLGIIGIN
jgi:hypothetical protein